MASCHRFNCLVVYVCIVNYTCDQSSAFPIAWLHDTLSLNNPMATTFDLCSISVYGMPLLNRRLGSKKLLYRMNYSKRSTRHLWSSRVSLLAPLLDAAAAVNITEKGLLYLNLLCHLLLVPWPHFSLCQKPAVTTKEPQVTVHSIMQLFFLDVRGSTSADPHIRSFKLMAATNAIGGHPILRSVGTPEVK
ncbi:hypothetical protein BKA62DRAFT_47569 [Auriculariales sp. MPI-PUGE-AT-0066]|nr:hypothetical protein BKA62DRAFT_47569 [Auriculariales sp. MPI-PUGE-AT-0066]